MRSPSSTQWTPNKSLQPLFNILHNFHARGFVLVGKKLIIIIIFTCNCISSKPMIRCCHRHYYRVTSFCIRSSALQLQEGKLPQTDRASAFVSQKFLVRAGSVVDPVKFSFHLVWTPCKLLVTVSRGECAHIHVWRTQKSKCDAGDSIPIPIEACVSMPNVVDIGQTVQASVRKSALNGPLASRLLRSV